MRTIFRLVRGAVVAGLLTGSIAGAKAQVTASGDGYLFRQKYTKGKTLHYAMKTSSAAMGQDVKVTISVTSKVLDVKNGIATVQMTLGDMVMNGKSMSQGTTRTMRIDNRGKTVSGDGAGALNAPWPEKPIRIGETFAANSGGVAAGMGNVSSKVTFKFLGFKTVNGQKVAQLTMAGTTGGDVTSKTNGIMLLSVDDGQLVSMKTTTNMSMKQQGKTVSTSSTMMMERK